MSASHPEYRWDLIDQGRIAVGMTKTEVMLAKDGFVKINRASYGEQWAYGFASRAAADSMSIFRTPFVLAGIDNQRRATPGKTTIGESYIRQSGEPPVVFF